MVGISILGGSASFCDKVKNDELGHDFEKECKLLEHNSFVQNQTVVYQRQDVLCSLLLTEKTSKLLGASTTLNESDIEEDFLTM